MNRIAFSFVVSLASVAAACGATLAVKIEPSVGERRLGGDSQQFRTSAGQLVAMSRLDFLVSDWRLRRRDGRWIAPADFAAFVSASSGRTAFEVKNVARGDYDRIMFSVGVPPRINSRDPAGYPADHPLNPNLNGLHWGWQGGFVFMAMEGAWWSAGNERSGFSYHLATDAHLTLIELPVDLALERDAQLSIRCDVNRILDGIEITDESSSTHSREGDPLAKQIQDNLAKAFAISAVKKLETVGGKVQPALVRMQATNATPHQVRVPAYVPAPALPLDNPLTAQGVNLGALLFFDPRLSVNRSQSCATCHQVDAAFTDRRAVSRGAEGQLGERNSMPLFNLAWKSSFFWDGRASSLREQVLQPIQNPIEMNQPMERAVAIVKTSRVNERHQIRAMDCLVRAENISKATLLDGSAVEDYPKLFAAAFGSPEITGDRIARALEQFLLAQTSFDSKFDRFMRGEAELTAQERRGFELFNTECDPRRGRIGADCFHCHGGPLFQSQAFANNGLDSEFKDSGRYAATGREGDKGKFATPSLRNIEVTGPYMHDGRFKTLDAIVEHYLSGVKRSPTLDPNLAKHPAGGIPLSADDRRALVAFLKTLTDQRFLTK